MFVCVRERESLLGTMLLRVGEKEGGSAKKGGKTLRYGVCVCVCVCVSE